MLVCNLVCNVYIYMYAHLTSGNNRETGSLFPGLFCSLFQMLLIIYIYIYKIDQILELVSLVAKSCMCLAYIRISRKTTVNFILNSFIYQALDLRILIIPR